MLSQLIIDKPVEPLQYLIEWLKRDNNDGMLVCFAFYFVYENNFYL